MRIRKEMEHDWEIWATRSTGISNALALVARMSMDLNIEMVGGRTYRCHHNLATHTLESFGPGVMDVGCYSESLGPSRGYDDHQRQPNHQEPVV